MNGNKIVVFLLCAAAIFIAAACSSSNNSHSNNAQLEENNNQLTETTEGNENNQDAVEDEPEPITLNLWTTRGELRNNWDELIVEPVQEMYPHITVELISDPLEEVIAAQVDIDLFFMN